MFRRLVLAACVLLAAPTAFAQQSQPETEAPPPPPLPLFYVSGGLAWSGEAGLELEAGLQADIGDFLRLRFSPANLALIDGDLPEGFYLDGFGFSEVCRDQETDDITFDEYCVAEPDTEWRSVVEAQFGLAPGFHFGAGVSYLLQGDFTPEDGRVAPFASFAWDMDDDMGIELRAGSEYLAFQIRGLW